MGYQVKPDKRNVLLATGESYRSLSFQYRIHHSWISICVKQVLQSIGKRMLHIYLPQPSKEQMEANASDFNSLWNYPNCCASIDGKYIRIRCPSNAGSLYFNYKNFHSIVLLAVVDARYRFVAIDVGSYGREGDAGIFIKSNIRKQIATVNCFNLPPPRFIPGTNMQQPHVILGDLAFSLTTNIMKPYSPNQAKHDKTKAIYNYRHSRARTSKDAFGIMCQYFRIFYTPIAVAPEVADNIIVSTFILHNMFPKAKISCSNENANKVFFRILQKKVC
ncbi:uncharacterized protein LOC126738181 [Anthonomus grandis grandis]|uniref:uncharacterized protein LOC126738181 n=1 Tax=Anthonomus grandis grandis TaxID=2921223 RepID=UPI0021668F3F|nr:uncharacterized protein LOC126738181 [Anthonomus grandis grandis]